MKHKAIAILLGFFILLAYADQATAFSKNGEHRFSSNEQALKEAQDLGLGISYRERIMKSQIEKQAQKKPQWLQERIADSLGDPAYYRSYLLEIRDGRQKVETAKVLARLSLYKAMKQNWEYVRTSIINRNAVEKFAQFELGLKRDLEKLEYIETKSPANGYVFETVEWGRVLVTQNQQTAKWSTAWSMDIASYLDSNQLEPGADKIKIDKDQEAPSFEPYEEDTPVTAPSLARPDRRQVVPQLRKSLQKSPNGTSAP